MKVCGDIKLKQMFENRKQYLIDLCARVKEMRQSVKLGFEMSLSPKLLVDPEYILATEKRKNETDQKESKKKKKKKFKKDKPTVPLLHKTNEDLKTVKEKIGLDHIL